MTSTIPLVRFRDREIYKTDEAALNTIFWSSLVRLGTFVLFCLVMLSQMKF